MWRPHKYPAFWPRGSREDTWWLALRMAVACIPCREDESEGRYREELACSKTRFLAGLFLALGGNLNVEEGLDDGVRLIQEAEPGGFCLAMSCKGPASAGNRAFFFVLLLFYPFHW